MPPTRDNDEKSTSDLVDKYINENEVMIFSKSWCPYCKKVGLVFHFILLFVYLFFVL